MPNRTMASRDVEAMRLMLQGPQAGDFVIATGEMHAVREFVKVAFSLVGSTR